MSKLNAALIHPHTHPVFVVVVVVVFLNAGNVFVCLCVWFCLVVDVLFFVLVFPELH